MKTGLGLFKKYRAFYAYLNLLRFWIRKRLLGFDVANHFIQRVDKISLQLILKKNGASIGEDCDIETGQIFHNCLNYSNLSIGNNCHIGKNCFFDLRDTIYIGNNVVISMQTTFITHIDMSKTSLSGLFPVELAPIFISDNVYIGARSVLLMGSRVNERTIVAAYTLVNKEITSKVIVAGVPAQIIKKIATFD